MKVLGFSAVTYVGSFWKESLLSIEPFVDKMYISYSRNPSHGQNTTLENPDTEYYIKKVAEEVMGSKLIWETFGGFTGEEEHRKTRYRHSAPYSLTLILDPDEIHDPIQLPQALKYAYTGDHRFYATRYFIHFWKSFEWCFFNDGDAPIRIENNLKDNILTDEGCPLKVYHTNMMQPEELLYFKFSTFGHKNEIKPKYMQEKFLAWTPDKIDKITHLHPSRDDIWIKPERFQGDLPDSLKNYKPKIKMKKKILLIPLDFHRHSQSPELFTDMLNSFLLVADTMLYQGDLKAAVDFKPDLILFQGGLPLADCIVLKKETGALFCMQTGDARYSPMQSLMNYRSIVDAYFVPFSGKLLDTYTTLLGKPCHFLWEYIQNWRFKTPKMLSTGLVGFVGNIYDSLPGGESRVKLKEIANRSSTEFNLRGSGFALGTIPNEEVPDFYNNCYGVIAENNHNFEDYFTPRNLGGLAAGSCTLMRYFPGIEKFFQDLVHCIYYRDDYELLSWVEYLKNNPQIRNTIASQGHGLACANFTLDNWVKSFFTVINNNYLK